MRLPDQADGDLPEFDPQDFAYWRPTSGIWYLHVPGVGLAGLRLHTVTEHPDGTITVSPSILVGAGLDGPRRHGYFERGIWRDV